MFEPVIEYDPHFRLSRIVIVGVGGTGCIVARNVARLAYDMRSRGMAPPHIVLVDPDKVESKNIGRQMAFTPADVGQYKAVVIARRLNFGLGLDIKAVPAELQDFNDGADIYMGCVDGYKGRQQIRDVTRSHNTWIDCGNHYSSGQVVIGNESNPRHLLSSLRNVKDDNKSRYYLGPALVFPELLQPDPEPDRSATVSCADLVQYVEQHLFINDMVATAATQYIYKLAMRLPITSFMSFVSINAGIQHIPATWRNLYQYVKFEEANRVA